MDKYQYIYEGLVYTICVGKSLAIVYITHRSSASESVVYLTRDTLKPWRVKRYGRNETEQSYEFIEEAIKAGCKAVHTPDQEEMVDRLSDFLKTQCTYIGG